MWRGNFFVCHSNSFDDAFCLCLLCSRVTTPKNMRAHRCPLLVCRCEILNHLEYSNMLLLLYFLQHIKMLN